MNIQSKLLIGLLSVLFISYAGNFALSKETKSVQKEQQAAKANLLTHEQIISEAQRGVDRSLTIMDHTISAIGVLVGLLGFLGFRTFGSLRKEIEKIEGVAGKSEVKYEEIEETLRKVKPMVDKITKYEKDTKGIKEKYEKKFKDLSISEIPSGDTKEKLDELTRKSEFLEDIGVELEAEDYFQRGLDYYYKDEYEKAKDAFGKAAELEPDNAVAWYNMGVTLDDLGEHKEAVKIYDKAIELKPDDVEAWSNRGVALSKLGKYKEAIQNHDKAVELRPGDADAWYNKACAYSLKGDKGKALENLRKAIELDPKYKEMSIKDEDFKSFWDDEVFKKIVE